MTQDSQPKNVRSTIIMSQEHWDLLDEIAGDLRVKERQNISRSEVVRRALKAYSEQQAEQGEGEHDTH